MKSVSELFSVLSVLNEARQKTIGRDNSDVLFKNINIRFFDDLIDKRDIQFVFVIKQGIFACEQKYALIFLLIGKIIRI